MNNRKPATDMLEKVWESREERARDEAVHIGRELAQMDDKIAKLVDTALEAPHPHIVKASEERIAGLEQDKLVLGGKLDNPAFRHRVYPGHLWQPAHPHQKLYPAVVSTANA